MLGLPSGAWALCSIGQASLVVECGLQSAQPQQLWLVGLVVPRHVGS